MKKDIAERWAKALEGGSYTQTVYSLCSTDKDGNNTCFCALGVLWDLWKEDHQGCWCAVGDQNYDGIFNMFMRTPSSNSVSRCTVITIWAEMTGVEEAKAIVWNDGDKLDFDQIAQKIREEMVRA